MTIKSSFQKVLDSDHFVFEGDVEVLLEGKLHVWADRVCFDKHDQVLLIESVDSKPIVIEDNAVLMFADRLEFNFIVQDGCANNVRFHLPEGYLSAKSARKINENDWCIYDMAYSACDKDNPHWSISAEKALVRTDHFIKASRLILKIGGVPIGGVPTFVIPLQAGSKSGFLLPRFLIDYDYGIGIKQEYYKYISPHSDTTFGVDWHDRKGVIFSNEFRWARSAESFTILNAEYGILRDRFLRKSDTIIKGAVHEYWLNGKNFQSWQNVFERLDVCSLMRLDFGTNKRIGYHFFNSVEEVDDNFNNTLIARLLSPESAMHFQVENAKTSRKTIETLSSPQRLFYANILPVDVSVTGPMIKEIENRVDLAYLPHIENNSNFKIINQYFSYRHDYFFDQVLYRQQELERIYLNSALLDQKQIFGLSKADVLRFNYRGHLAQSITRAYNTFSLYIDPRFQVISQRRDPYKKTSMNVCEHGILNKGAYRVFFEYGAEWALPEWFAHDDNYNMMYSFQPMITWDWVPKFFQDHWFYFDHRDRAYAKNQLALVLRNTWMLEKTIVDLNIKQGYDFYNNKDIFYMRRGINQKHLLPLRCELDCMSRNFQVGLTQEYEWGSFRPLQLELNFLMSLNRLQVGLGYLFQSAKLLDKRQLLSRITHFVTLNCVLPFSKRATLSYDGQLYAAQRRSTGVSTFLKPLIHRLRLDYDGHCWGFYIGFEEKQFMEYGNARRERAVVFSLRLDSLGSFAKKFKRMPEFLKAQT